LQEQRHNERKNPPKIKKKEEKNMARLLPALPAAAAARGLFTL
jgi:hypothetical protein